VQACRGFDNHRTIGWKRPLRSSSETIHPAPPCLLIHILKCHIYTYFEHPQGWGLSHLPGQPVPMSDHLVSVETFLLFQHYSEVDCAHENLALRDGSSAVSHPRKNAIKVVPSHRARVG